MCALGARRDWHERARLNSQPNTSTSAFHVCSTWKAHQSMGQEMSIPDFIGTEITFERNTVKIRKHLSEGGLGHVFLVEDMVTGQEYALKRMCTARDNVEMQNLAHTELQLNRNLPPHSNLVRYISSREIVRENGDIEYLMLLEYCNGGSLLQVVQQQQQQHSVNVPEMLRCFGGICAGVAHLHSQNPPITHRDLKLENVLLSRSGAYKICDMGSSTTEPVVTFRSRSQLARLEEEIERFTTAAYRAPEMCDLHSFNDQMDSKVDIWALGCILYTLFFLRSPFETGSKAQILSGKYQIPDDAKCPSGLVPLLKGMLTVEPRKRFNITNVVQHLIPIMTVFNVSTAGLPVVPPLEVEAPKPAPKAAASDAAAALGFDDSSWEPEFPAPSSAASPEYDPFPQHSSASSNPSSPDQSSSLSPAAPVPELHSDSASRSVLIPPKQVAAAAAPQPQPQQQSQPPARTTRASSLLLAPAGGLYSQSNAPAVKREEVGAANSAAIELLFGKPPANASRRSKTPPLAAVTEDDPASQPGNGRGADNEDQQESNITKFFRGVFGVGDSVGKWIRRCTEESMKAPKAKYVRALIVVSWENNGLPELFKELDRRPVKSDCLVAVKSLEIVHKLLQDGAPPIVATAWANKKFFADIEQSWQRFASNSDSQDSFSSAEVDAASLSSGALNELMADMICAYASFLLRRLELHKKVPMYEGNFALSGFMQSLHQAGYSRLNRRAFFLEQTRAVRMLIELIGKCNDIGELCVARTSPRGKALPLALIEFRQQFLILVIDCLHAMFLTCTFVLTLLCRMPFGRDELADPVPDSNEEVSATAAELTAPLIRLYQQQYIRMQGLFDAVKHVQIVSDMHRIITLPKSVPDPAKGSRAIPPPSNLPKLGAYNKVLCERFVNYAVSGEVNTEPMDDGSVDFPPVVSKPAPQNVRQRSATASTGTKRHGTSAMLLPPAGGWMSGKRVDVNTEHDSSQTVQAAAPAVSESAGSSAEDEEEEEEEQGDEEQPYDSDHDSDSDEHSVSESDEAAEHSSRRRHDSSLPSSDAEGHGDEEDEDEEIDHVVADARFSAAGRRQPLQDSMMDLFQHSQPAATSYPFAGAAAVDTNSSPTLVTAEAHKSPFKGGAALSVVLPVNNAPPAQPLPSGVARGSAGAFSASTTSPATLLFPAPTSPFDQPPPQIPLSGGSASGAAAAALQQQAAFGSINTPSINTPVPLPDLFGQALSSALDTLAQSAQNSPRVRSASNVSCPTSPAVVPVNVIPMSPNPDDIFSCKYDTDFSEQLKKLHPPAASTAASTTDSFAVAVSSASAALSTSPDLASSSISPFNAATQASQAVLAGNAAPVPRVTSGNNSVTVSAASTPSLAPTAAVLTAGSGAAATMVGPMAPLNLTSTAPLQLPASLQMQQLHPQLQHQLKLQQLYMQQQQQTPLVGNVAQQQMMLYQMQQQQQYLLQQQQYASFLASQQQSLAQPAVVYPASQSQASQQLQSTFDYLSVSAPAAESVDVFAPATSRPAAATASQSYDPMFDPFAPTPAPVTTVPVHTSAPSQAESAVPSSIANPVIAGNVAAAVAGANLSALFLPPTARPATTMMVPPSPAVAAFSFGLGDAGSAAVSQLKEADSTVRPVVQRAPEARALVFDEVSTADSQGQDLNFDDLTLGERIGIGAFAEVFKARWHSEEVAVKRLLANNQTQESIDEFWSEVAVMRRLSHPNIVAFKGACQNPSCVVTELLQGNLWDLLHNSRVELPFRERLHMLQDAASGMAHLHSFNPPIVHRDLKSANLLYDKQHRVKVGDFGLSRAKEVQYTMTGQCGTFQWMSPEVMQSQRYTEKADVFSFGIILWEVLFRQVPYQGMNSVQVSIAVITQNLRPPIPSDTPVELARLMQECWSTNPASRPIFPQIIERLIAIEKKYCG